MRTSTEIPSVPTFHSRGYLPHLDAPGRPQFITFRLVDAVPASLVESWKEELRSILPGERALQVQRRAERYADAGHGECWLARLDIAELVTGAIRFHDGRLYAADCWVIMPNHVHLAALLRQGVELKRVMHAIRSYTAHEANRILGREGRFWGPDYFDRAIRDDHHFAAVRRYVERNPYRAGLDARFREPPWLLRSKARSHE